MSIWRRAGKFFCWISCFAWAITVEGEGQLRFDDGDITYCPGNNTAAIFYAQSSRPNLTMTVYPIGKVTSDLSIFPDLPNRVEITFELAEEAA